MSYFALDRKGADLFESQSGIYEIYTIKPDGSGQKTLTSKVGALT